MVVNVSKLLKKIVDLYAAAFQAGASAGYLDTEARKGILALAENWDAQVNKEEDRIIRFLIEAEAASLWSE